MVELNSPEAYGCLNRDYYPVISKITGTYYLTLDNRVYAYEEKEKADLKSAELAEAETGISFKLTSRTKANIISDIYAMGCDRLILVKKNEDPVEINLSDKTVRQQFYNRSATRTLILFAETKEKSYLVELAKQKFVIPCRVDENQFVFPDIVYNGEKMFPAYTDNMDIEGYDSLTVKFGRLLEISNGRKAIINPGKLGMVITDNIADFMAKSAI